MSDTATNKRLTGWIYALLATLAAGSIAAVSNLTNFVAPRSTYFAVWGVAHLLAFCFGLWAARAVRVPCRPSAYLTLALIAGIVEAVIVFGVLDGLIINGLELGTGFEDYIVVAATIVLFTAGALRGARGLLGDEGDAAPTRGDRRIPRPSPAVTQTLGVAGPALALVGEVIKLTSG